MFLKGVLKMASKYELTISTDYVKDWGIVEAVRELFQNAIDNEITNPENTMYFEFSADENKLSIGNKTSVLTLDTLLLGKSSKREDSKTIGKHGEGYKIAFMVLLREGKSIKVYNYGAKEVWETRLVKSRRYGNLDVPVVFVNKVPMWSKVPSHDLMIEVEGVTEEEYKGIIESNLHLQDVGEVITDSVSNKVLLSPKYSGHIFVRGLYVSSNPALAYGYDFAPEVINLDRDRKLIDTFNLSWNTSRIWSEVGKSNQDILLELIKNKKLDANYITDVYPIFKDNTFSNKLLEDFKETNGEDSVPVSNNEELKAAIQDSKEPVMVSEQVMKILKESDEFETVAVKPVSLKEQFETWLDKVSSKLSPEEIDEFNDLIEKV